MFLLWRSRRRASRNCLRDRGWEDSSPENMMRIMSFTLVMQQSSLDEEDDDEDDEDDDEEEGEEEEEEEEEEDSVTS